MTAANGGGTVVAYVAATAPIAARAIIGAGFPILYHDPPDTPLDRRDGLAQAVRYTADTAGTLHTPELAHLGTVAEQEIVRHAVVAGGGTLTTGDNAGDEVDLHRATIRECLQMVAALEAATAKAGPVVAAARSRAAGRWPGEAPYGWKAEGGQLTPNPAELAVVEWITRQRDRGESWRGITDRLNDAGTPAPRGGVWHAATARRIAQGGTVHPLERTPAPVTVPGLGTALE